MRSLKHLLTHRPPLCGHHCVVPTVCHASHHSQHVDESSTLSNCVRVCICVCCVVCVGMIDCEAFNLRLRWILGPGFYYTASYAIVSKYGAAGQRMHSGPFYSYVPPHALSHSLRSIIISHQSSLCSYTVA